MAANDRNVFLRFYCNASAKSEYTVINLAEDREFDFSSQTKFIIHDLNSHPQSDFLLDMKTLYLERGNNVMMLDWAELARQNTPSDFPGLVRLRLQTTASSVIEILDNLITKCHLELSNVHLVGHSLGCHLGGIIARSFKERGFLFGRITALDPFRHEIAATLSGLIYNEDDAFFIDAYHNKVPSPCQLVAQVDFVIHGACPGSDVASDFGDSFKVFLQTIMEGSELNDVTNAVTWTSQGHNEGATMQTKYDGPIIFGEHCRPGTKGQYELQYDSNKRGVIGSLKQKQT